MSWYKKNTGLKPQQMPLPAGWEAKYDPKNRRWFYLNHATKATQWDDPRLTMQMETRQPHGRPKKQQTQKAKAETSFMQINADDTKVKKFILNKSYVVQLHKDYETAGKDLISDILRRNGNDYQATVSLLQSQGHAKKIVADELLVTQLKSEYKDAPPDFIRLVLVQLDNNVGRFRPLIQKMGFVKGGKEVNKSKPAKKKPTQAEKNKILLKKDNKKSSKPKSFEMPSDDLYKSTSLVPVIFGEETEFRAMPEVQLFDMSKLSSSTRPSIISMLNRPQAPKVTKPKLTPQKQTARQKKVSTVQQKNYQARNVNWKTSGNRMKPTGPDPSLRNGPDPSLLILEYVAAMGPNKDIRNGPQAANRCGPLPSNRNGPGNLAVGPVKRVFYFRI